MKPTSALGTIEMLLHMYMQSAEKITIKNLIKKIVESTFMKTLKLYALISSCMIQIRHVRSGCTCKKQFES